MKPMTIGSARRCADRGAEAGQRVDAALHERMVRRIERRAANRGRQAPHQVFVRVAFGSAIGYAPPAARASFRSIRSPVFAASSIAALRRRPS